MSSLFCRATASRCRCGLPMHSDDTPHECFDKAHCAGSWYGDSIDDENFQVVKFPILGADGDANVINGEVVE